MPVSEKVDLLLRPKQAHDACLDALNRTYVLVAWNVEDETYYDIFGQGRYRAIDVMFDFRIAFKILKGGGVRLQLKADTINSAPLQSLANCILEYEEKFLQSFDQKTPAERKAIERSAYDAVVFLSYAREDYKFAEKLRKDLFLCQMEVWLDQDYLRTGDSWPEEIESAIRNADAFVLVVSPQALESDWVKRELEHARKTKTPILPVVFGETVFPGWFQRQFGKIETADLTKNKYLQGVDELVDVIKQKAEAKAGIK